MKALQHFRVIALLEGLSFLVLLLVAMPLKHLWGLPLAVRIMGSVHGLFVLLFLSALARVVTERTWSLRRSAIAVLASLVPFGAFALDRSLKRELASHPESLEGLENGRPQARKE